MLIIQTDSPAALKRFENNMQELEALMAFYAQVSQYPIPNPAAVGYYDADILIK
jgi:hypothetical protein